MVLWFSGPDGFGPLLTGEVIPETVGKDLALTESQARTLTELQQYVSTELSRTLTPRQQEQIKQMKTFADAGFGPPPGFGGPGFGPPGFRPPDGGRPGEQRGPGRIPGGPGGIFRCYRYAPNYAGLVNRDLTPGKTLLAVVNTDQQSPKADRGR